MTREEEIERVVKGFLVPVFEKPSPNGGVLNGVSPKDFEKVKAGFACSLCLAEFREYTPKCPVCGKVRDTVRDFMDAPQDWVEYLRERNLDTPASKTPVLSPAAAVQQHLQTIGAVPRRRH